MKSKHQMEEETRLFLKPSGKFETIDELFRNRNITASPVRKGLKKTVPCCTAEEQEETLRLQNELRLLISRPRVERLVARSIGEWDSEQQAVKLIRKEGKFQGFGYTANKVDYLENYEALFLLELNRLELYFNTVIVSAEQAYLLLLGEEKSRSYDKYLVYSTLSRAGYIAQKYTNRTYSPKIAEDHPCNETDCIWEILRSKLNSNYEIPTHIKNHDKFATISSSMAAIVQKTKNYITPETSSEPDHKPLEFCPAKRRHSTSESQTAAKKIKLNYESPKQSKSFLDCLKNEKDYQKFQEIFEQIDMIELKAFEDYDDENSREFELDFDLYLPSGSFRKNNAIPPNFRVIVLGSEDKFPSRSELVKAFRSQRVAVPLLVVSVSLSKHIQAVLYHFT